MPRAKKATEAPTDPLDAMLVRLQLSGIRDQLDSLLDEAARANLSARETQIPLCERKGRQCANGRQADTCARIRKLSGSPSFY